MTAKYDIFEASFAGPASGNPYLEVSFDAVFLQHSREVRVPGFYDGDGTYRVRFRRTALLDRTAHNLSDCRLSLFSSTLSSQIT